MSKKTVNNIQLGFFVLIGAVFLIAALYLIGNNRNLFSQTFQLRATFYQVNGLMKGNNVRFSGINVGTVKSVTIVSDTSVDVTMIIEDDAQKFIKKNSAASIGTDGLMGNKLINIINFSTLAESVEDGDIIKSIRPVETDQMLRTLDQTNENLSTITSDLKKITQKLSNRNTLWSILMDTVIAENVKYVISDIRVTTRNTSAFSKDLHGLLEDINNGKGMIGYMVGDTSASGKLKRSVTKINESSEHTEEVAKNLEEMTRKIKNGQGGAGILLSDTAFANDLSKSMRNIRMSSEKLNENIEAMRHHVLFRGYFKDQEKKRQKAGGQVVKPK